MQTHNINLNSKVEGHLFHLAIGNFDGIHLGHQQIINSLVKKAKESNRSSAIFGYIIIATSFISSILISRLLGLF